MGRGWCDDQPALSGTAFDGWCSDTYGQQFWSSFKGGPYLAYGVGGKTKIDGVSEKADTFGDDGLKRFDAGLGLELLLNLAT